MPVSAIEIKLSNAFEHLKSSGTKAFMNGPKLYEVDR